MLKLKFAKCMNFSRGFNTSFFFPLFLEDKPQMAFQNYRHLQFWNRFLKTTGFVRTFWPWAVRAGVITLWPLSQGALGFSLVAFGGEFSHEIPFPNSGFWTNIIQFFEGYIQVDGFYSERKTFVLDPTRVKAVSLVLSKRHPRTTNYMVVGFLSKLTSCFLPMFFSGALQQKPVNV